MPETGSKYRYLYGPVPSRRLGRSLGIDLVPYKICSYNCTYCQLGETTNLTIERRPYTPASDIIAELERWMREDGDADYLTLSGSGEPTLNSEIGQVIEFVRSHTEIPIALITNGTLLWDSDLRAEIHDLDLLVPSLDAALEDIWLQVDRPAEGLDLQQTIDGIAQARRECQGRMWLEVLLVAGVSDSDDHLTALRRAIDQIGPDLVQINTVVRPPAQTGARPLSPERLHHALEMLGPNAEIIAPVPESSTVRESHKQTTDAVLELLKRRPCTIADVATGLSIHPSEVIKHIQILLTDKRIRPLDGDGPTFYAAES